MKQKPVVLYLNLERIFVNGCKLGAFMKVPLSNHCSDESVDSAHSEEGTLSRLMETRLRSSLIGR
jgi:hypothetical protein